MNFQLVNGILFAAVVLYAVYLFLYSVVTRLQYIKLGKEEKLDLTFKDRFENFWVNVVGQKKLLKDRKSGLMHLVLFYAFFIIQLGLIELIIKAFVPGYTFPLGKNHEFFTFIQEWTMFLMLCALIYAAYRRYGEKLERLQWKRDQKAAFVYIALITLCVSLFLALGFETVALGDEPDFIMAPFSGFVALVFGGLNPDVANVLFYVFWWVHMLAVFTFLVFVPQSKQFHEVFVTIGLFFKRAKKAGRLRKIDFDDEEAESFGVGKIEDFTRIQLMDLYSCVECGRCTNMCPATGTGKMLSPMDLMIKLRDHLTYTGAVVTKRKPWVPGFVWNKTKGNQLAMAAGAEGAVIEDIYSPSLIGDVITEEEIWACTTCRNCEDQCPVMNEHVHKIIDLRRYLTMTEGRINPDAQRALNNIERQGNPWGLNRKERENWRDLDPAVHIPTVKEAAKSEEGFEYLFWVGSMGSYDSRSQKIAMSFARLLNAAGVKFAILGNKEKNSGDTPRRLGNEFLFQELAEGNIKEFEKYGVKKIVTIDPHAYNIFKNEYKDFGWEGEVYHHTELLHKLIEEGKLTLNYPVNETIVFHDSCYLGRYNNVYDAPREILKAIPGVKLVEMERNRETAMCCGAGGGLMWMEDRVGNRINVARTEQALATNASVISAGCPYCLTMLTDGTKAKEVEDQIKTYDVCELLERSVFGEKVKEEAAEETAVPEEEAAVETQ
ncbi:(Fe-S)-binding protein [Ureibacillus terrenus]|uniref:(Fe-S)-binding protein n=1 Tax=Ureibacillus terrenus TaxID=118246 RepID=A0A540V278_9BACL|nr:(Fe-S)-binding protein [Ureibacillus terrenus]MED3661344.1 (Fe-S)-binding protein [Ureibacillus terrenus]MED3764184.1 (Fe-S)-binding protein [Ureibacillus terrenus]TQE90862.1 (Fe-S)-binding protein [Ureibacillus terrenus]